jgi:hypothetical protein
VIGLAIYQVGLDVTGLAIRPFILYKPDILIQKKYQAINHLSLNAHRRIVSVTGILK